MAEGWSATAANHLLDTELAIYKWLKLHVGAPGAAGTANPATETTRKEITWGSAAGGAATSITNALTWTNVAGTEDYTHATLWSLVSSGVFGLSGGVTANPVVAGDTFTIAVGDVDVTVPVAS